MVMDTTVEILVDIFDQVRNDIEDGYVQDETFYFEQIEALKKKPNWDKIQEFIISELELIDEKNILGGIV